MADVRNRRRRLDEQEMVDENIWRSAAEIGAELRRLREERGWTLEDVAERDPYLDVDKMVLLESGERSVIANELVHLDELYGCPNHDIMVRPDAPLSERLKIERGTLRVYEDMYELMDEHDLYGDGLTDEDKALRLERVRGDIEEQRRRVLALEAQLALQARPLLVTIGSADELPSALQENGVVRGA
jgi:transcriptional regulator with XRE-family HTH domain